MAGFTTVQNVGNAGDKALREEIGGGNRGRAAHSDVARTDPGWTRPRRTRFASACGSSRANGADLIKIFASESIRTGGAPTMTQEQLDAACGEAKTLGLRTLVHAHAAEADHAAASRPAAPQVEHGAFADRRGARS